MKKKTAQVNINLAPKDPFFDTTLGKVLRWSLTVGRYIVIFTELVVIFSFATRFTLDRRVTDLNDSIFQKESVIKSYGDLEDKVRLTQFQIEQYQQVEQLSNLADIFPILSAITPQDVRLDNLVIKPASVSLEGTTLTQSSFNTLINNIQLSGKFFNVTVDRIESDQEKNPGIHFVLHAATQPPEVKTTVQKTEAKTSVLDRTQGLEGI